MVKGLLILLLGGPVLFVALLAGGLGAFPLYVTKALFLLGPALLLAGIAAASGYLTRRAMRRMGLGLLAVIAGCAVFVGFEAYRDSLDTVDDREMLLWQYEPFREDNRLAVLDAPAALALEPEEEYPLPPTSNCY